MRSLYVYYRIQLAHEASLWQAVTDIQHRLRSRMPGLAAALHQRLDPGTSGLHTWMEVYHFNGHANDQAWSTFEAALLAQAATLPAGIEGERHLERFVRHDGPTALPPKD